MVKLTNIMVKILGIDPGSRITGYGIVNHNQGTLSYVASGAIKTLDTNLAHKLLTLYDGIAEIIETYQPDVVAIERVFLAHNVDSALKLGQARGALIASCAKFNLNVFEYTARQVKQSAVGTGAATKKQVQTMVMQLLQLNLPPQIDASDALAVAMCHANFHITLLAHDLGTASKRKRRIRL